MKIAAVGVVGLGTMGAGIAEVFARAGLDVVGVEIDADTLAAGRRRVDGSLDRAVSRGRLDPAAREEIGGRLTYATDRAEMSAVDLVVEAVPERLDIKAELFDDLDRICQPHCVLATNTSSLSVTAIAAATKRPARVVGMHFFNPAPVMRLVEVVRTVLTDGEAVDAVVELAQQCDKTPISVGDRAGFVANALLLPYLNDAARVVETGRASVADVDAAVTELAGFPMGPLALTDLIGLDVTVAILDVLWDEFRDRRYATSPLLRRLATAGHLGRKTGRGWYHHDGNDLRPAIGPASATAYDATPLLTAHLADAMRMVSDGYATEADVDTAMRLGCGYPEGPFELIAAQPELAAQAPRRAAG